MVAAVWAGRKGYPWTTRHPWNWWRHFPRMSVGFGVEQEPQEFTVQQNVNNWYIKVKGIWVLVVPFFGLFLKFSK